jgi:hypothetical protein
VTDERPGGTDANFDFVQGKIRIYRGLAPVSEMISPLLMEVFNAQSTPKYLALNEKVLSGKLTDADDYAQQKQEIEYYAFRNQHDCIWSVMQHKNNKWGEDATVLPYMEPFLTLEEFRRATNAQNGELYRKDFEGLRKRREGK